jgi:hypothetical protein
MRADTRRVRHHPRMAERREHLHDGIERQIREVLS